MRGTVPRPRIQIHKGFLVNAWYAQVGKFRVDSAGGLGGKGKSALSLSLIEAGGGSILYKDESGYTRGK